MVELKKILIDVMAHNREVLYNWQEASKRRGR